MSVERMIFDLMAQSDDRVLCEMGRELGEGNVTLRGLGDVPAYRAALESSLERVGDIDLGAMSQQLDEVIEAESEGLPADAAADDDADPDELWQGFGRESGDR